MHSYDLAGRTQTLAKLALVAYGIAGGTHHLAWGPELDIERWVIVPSFGLTFAILRGLVDRWGWRLPFVRQALGISVRDLHGSWQGHLWSSYGPSPDDPSGRYAVKVTIQQTWTQIFIHLQTDRSASDSISAAWRGSGTADGELVYTYENLPFADSPTTMERHGGTTILRVRDGKLIGEYYSGRGRQQHGQFELQKDLG